MRQILPQSAKKLRFGVFVALLAVGTATSVAQQNEYQVKAAFLINFLKFVEWPDKTGPYIIDIAGKNPFGTYLEGLANSHTINGRKVIVRTEKHGNSPLPSIVFVPASESERFGEYLQYAKKPVIVIGESPGFAKKHGAINFIFERDRIAFEINPRLAKSSGVKVSSRLLQLAKIVD